MKKERKDFMTEKQKVLLGDLRRTHRNCLDKVGVARPGKTAKDKSK